MAQTEPPATTQTATTTATPQTATPQTATPQTATTAATTNAEATNAATTNAATTAATTNATTTNATTSAASETTMPLPAPPDIRSQKTLETLLGSHPFTLQWVGWDRPGVATIARTADGALTITGRQQGSGDSRGNVATLEGRITRVDDDGFVVDGVASAQIGFIAGGRPCAHAGRSLVFRATGKRKYWRLQQMDSPCDGVTDYYDVYFAESPSHQ